MYVRVELEDVVAEYSEEQILTALANLHKREPRWLPATVDVMKEIPKLIEDLAATQADAERGEEWNRANALCDLRLAVEVAFKRFKGK